MPFLFAQGGAHVTEARYQAQLIRKLKRMFPDAILMKNDWLLTSRGFPDWTHSVWLQLGSPRDQGVAVCSQAAEPGVLHHSPEWNVLRRIHLPRE
jgi:hypothetical protein